MHNTLQMRSWCCWSDNNTLNSSNSLSNSSNSLQEHDIFCNSLSMNLSAVNCTQRKKLNVKQQCNNTFTSTLQDLNVTLQQTKKKWDLLLIKCWFASVQQEVQTLWHQNDHEVFVNKLIKKKQEIKLLKEQIHSVASVKKSAEKAMSTCKPTSVCKDWKPFVRSCITSMLSKPVFVKK